jgi:hypothetical protein
MSEERILPWPLELEDQALSAAPRFSVPGTYYARNPIFVPVACIANVNGRHGAIKAARDTIRRGALTFSRAVGPLRLQFVMEAQPFGRTGVSDCCPARSSPASKESI